MAARKIVPSEAIEGHVSSNIVNRFRIGRQNQKEEDDSFEAVLDMLECQRTEKDYDWMSDVFIPEYPSIFLTESSMWVNQYFQNRAFVDVYLEGDDREDMEKAQIAKRVINRTLNNRKVHHYQKYVRARSINSARGCVYVIGMWKRREREEVVGYRPVLEDYYNEEGQIATRVIQDPVRGQVVVEDYFNYEVVDPRNVATDNRYCYSMQEKDWVIIRSEVSYEQLKSCEEENGYINLDDVKGMVASETTETRRETLDKDEPDKTTKDKKPQIQYFDKYLQMGKEWAIVLKRDEDGHPMAAKPGILPDGKINPKAELVEIISEVVTNGAKKVLVRFQPNPFRTNTGEVYRPIIRGLCYIHPTKDVGMSDGKYGRELQVALNDTVNMSNDRTKLATIPTFKGRRDVIDDNDQIYIEPEHVIPLNDPEHDLVEVNIKDNVNGAMNQAMLFIEKMQQVASVYPSTMGRLPAPSTTATAIQATENRSDTRSNYKSLTFEYTFLCEFYWMILQMTWQFMHPDTARKMMGEKAYLFDPDLDYTYKPVSSNIEMEYNKDRKVQRWDQILGRIASVPSPLTPMLIAYIVGKQCELLGEEYQTVAALLEAYANTPLQQQGRGEGEVGGEGNPVPDARPPLTQNEEGMPVGPAERYTRPIDEGA